MKLFKAIAIAALLMAAAAVSIGAGNTYDDVHVFTGNGATAGISSVTGKIMQIDVVGGAGPKNFALRAGGLATSPKIWEKYTSSAVNGTTYSATLWTSIEGFKIPKPAAGATKSLYLNTDSTTDILYVYTKGIQ